MPRHNFTRDGKLTFRVRSVRNTGVSGQQNRRHQEVLRRNAEEQALIQDLFRRNNQYIREHQMDPDFGRIHGMSGPEYVDILLANTDGINGRRPAPRREARQEPNEEKSTTENADIGESPPAKKDKVPGNGLGARAGDAAGAAQEPSAYLRAELSGFGSRW